MDAFIGFFGDVGKVFADGILSSWEVSVLVTRVIALIGVLDIDVKTRRVLIVVAIAGGSALSAWMQKKKVGVGIPVWRQDGFDWKENGEIDGS